MACQASPLSRLGQGAQALDAPVDWFQRWQENTNSIFWTAEKLRQQMEVWFSIVRNRGREANTPAEAERFVPALLPSASGELLSS